MHIAYQDWNPKPETLALVEMAQQIIRQYQAEGYILTLRQLYYQFVSKDLIPNSERSYKNLGSVITKARMAGLISWTAIEDRNRGHNTFYSQEDLMQPIRDLPGMIEYDRWARQDTYVEVWVEKEALGNVVGRACGKLWTPHMACKGYLSASEAWRAGRRFQEKLDEGKNCVVIHLGDHDPSGIDMTRDNQDRLDTFSEYVGGVDVRRIALNMDQVDEYAPPPNPAKVTDSRASGYIQRFGRTSWELDALEPSVIEELITDEIEGLIDYDAWYAVDEEEEEVRERLSAVGRHWPRVNELLSRLAKED